MKVLIAYYSKGGSTKKVALQIADQLRERGHSVDMEVIIPKKEHSFFVWSIYRTFTNECDIVTPNNTDVSGYDLILIGSPNWTKLALPVSRYMEMITGLEHKRVALFSTTAFIPSIEWHIISAYLLDITFSRKVDKKRARNVGSLLLSSIFASWNSESEWGKTNLARFLDSVTSTEESIKKYVLRQKEKQGLRLLTTLVPFAVVLLLLVILLTNQLIIYSGFSTLVFAVFGIGIISFVFFMTLFEHERYIYLGKYLASFSLVSLWVIFTIYTDPSLGRGIIAGYIIILTFMSAFRDPYAVLFTGIAEATSLLILQPMLSSPVINIPIDMTFIILSTGVVSIITRNLQGNTIDLLDAQEELENAQKNLERNYNELQSATIQIQSEKDKTATILSHLADGVLVFDANKKLMYANPQAVKYINNIDADEDWITDSTLGELGSTQNMQHIFRLVEESISRKEVSFGTDRTYEVRIEPVRLEDQGPVVILADLHDITERKELDAMKVDFASIAAHELRTPITTITGYLSLLEEELFSTLDRNHAMFLHRAIESTKRLNSTVESLLAVTRVEKGQSAVHMESVDLIQQAQETIDEMELYAAEKQQSLLLQVVDTQIPRVVADSLKVKEILVNLIGNAIKYTQSKGAIEISLDQTNEYVQVHVKDNGPGITEKTQKFLFRKFSRGDNPLTEQTQGVGLGLYLVKSLVELQGGSIWVNSSAGKGTTFSFRLPKEHNYLHEKT